MEGAVTYLAQALVDRPGPGRAARVRASEGGQALRAEGRPRGRRQGHWPRRPHRERACGRCSPPRPRSRGRRPGWRCSTTAAAPPQRLRAAARAPARPSEPASPYAGGGLRRPRPRAPGRGGDADLRPRLRAALLDVERVRAAARGGGRAWSSRIERARRAAKETCSSLRGGGRRARPPRRCGRDRAGLPRGPGAAREGEFFQGDLVGLEAVDRGGRAAGQGGRSLGHRPGAEPGHPRATGAGELVVPFVGRVRPRGGRPGGAARRPPAGVRWSRQRPCGRSEILTLFPAMVTGLRRGEHPRQGERAGAVDVRAARHPRVRRGQAPGHGRRALRRRRGHGDEGRAAGRRHRGRPGPRCRAPGAPDVPARAAASPRTGRASWPAPDGPDPRLRPLRGRGRAGAAPMSTGSCPLGDFVLTGGELAALASSTRWPGCSPACWATRPPASRELRGGAAGVPAVHPAPGLPGRAGARVLQSRRPRPASPAGGAGRPELTRARRPDLLGRLELSRRRTEAPGAARRRTSDVPVGFVLASAGRALLGTARSLSMLEVPESLPCAAAHPGVHRIEAPAPGPHRLPHRVTPSACTGRCARARRSACSRSRAS